MKKYIRTKDGRIIDCVKLIKEAKKHIVQNEEDYGLAHILVTKTYDAHLGWERRVAKQADTIEELICDDDILYTYNLYPDAVLVVEGNIKPFGYQNAMKLKEWLKYTWIKFDLYIKDRKGNYIKRAKKEAEGKLELL